MKNLAVATSIVSLFALLLVSGLAAQTQSTTSNMTGHHTMDGEVTKVDAKKGWVDVKTADGSMKLHFPPPALDNVKTGDSVTVDIAMVGSAAKKSETK